MSENLRKSFDGAVVTGDLLRPFRVGTAWESGTWKNVRWLYHLLNTPLKLAGLSCSQLIWDHGYSNSPRQHFDTPSLYHELGLEVNLQNWAALSVLKSAPTGLLARLSPLQDSLVIGYEMPNIMLAALKELDITYIDIALHPIRFLDDLVFGMRSNAPEVQDFFKRHALPSEVIERGASGLKAKLSWITSQPQKLSPGSALLLGQVSEDRAAVLPNGKFARLEDYLPRILGLCAEHPDVYYKPHPYQHDKRLHSAIIDSFPTVKVIDTNIYMMLAQPELHKVVALNSSGLIEARAFGVNAENFIPFLYDFSTSHQADPMDDIRHIALTSLWLEGEFWHSLLQNLDGSASLQEASRTFRNKNYLRFTLNADWGWGEIEKVVVK